MEWTFLHIFYVLRVFWYYIGALKVIKKSLVFIENADFFLSLQSLLFCLFDLILDFNFGHCSIDHNFHLIVSISVLVLLHFLRLLKLFVMVVCEVGEILKLWNVVIGFVYWNLHSHLVKGTCIVQRVDVLKTRFLLCMVRKINWLILCGLL